jgi:hypothetical protein
MPDTSEQTGQERGSEQPPIASVLTASIDLDEQLTALQSDAAEHYPGYRRNHELLWRLLSKTYLWWRKASEVDDYLESQYEQKGIRYRSHGNRPNFNPLIRLVWDIGDIEQADRVTISQWNKALQKMHAQYLQQPKDFNHNPEGKLTALLQTQGGVAGLAAIPDIADEPHHSRSRGSLTKNADAGGSDARVTAEISRQALAQVNAFTEIAAFTTEEPIRVGADGFLVLLARRDRVGRITILGSSNDPAQIEAVAATIARRDVVNVTPSLRALVQIVATQAFPSHALPSSGEKRAKWYRTRYAEPGDLHVSDLEGWEGEQRGQPLTSWKRLLLRGGREAILSGSVVTVSPVTRCLLADPLIEVGDAVFLRPRDLAAIEQWYASGELAFLRAEPELRLERTEAGLYKLIVKSAITDSTEILQFYRHSPDANVAHYQAEFRRDAFEPTWRTGVPAEWFATLRQVWTDKWFAELGRFNQITRKNNAVLEVKVEADKFHVIFNRDSDASASETIAFPREIPGLAGPETTTYFSKDLAPILFNLADAQVSGAVTMSGNEHALVFTYDTSVGQFEIAVPTLDEAGENRDSTLFCAPDRRQ